MRFAIVLAVVALAACAKKAEDKKPPPAMPAAEIQRGQDACKAYADRACACTAPAGPKACEQAKPLPQALEIAVGVATSPSSAPEDAARAQVNVRETVKECIEQLAKLPALGCP
jgi:hypothetical protein